MENLLHKSLSSLKVEVFTRLAVIKTTLENLQMQLEVARSRDSQQTEHLSSTWVDYVSHVAYIRMRTTSRRYKVFDPGIDQ